MHLFLLLLLLFLAWQIGKYLFAKKVIRQYAEAVKISRAVLLSLCIPGYLTFAEIDSEPSHQYRMELEGNPILTLVLYRPSSFDFNLLGLLFGGGQPMIQYQLGAKEEVTHGPLSGIHQALLEITEYIVRQKTIRGFPDN